MTAAAVGYPARAGNRKTITTAIITREAQAIPPMTAGATQRTTGRARGAIAHGTTVATTATGLTAVRVHLTLLLRVAAARAQGRIPAPAAVAEGEEINLKLNFR